MQDHFQNILQAKEITKEINVYSAHHVFKLLLNIDLILRMIMVLVTEYLFNLPQSLVNA